MTTCQNAHPCSDLDGVPTPWLEIRRLVLSPDAVLMHLGAGERETLLLAQELRADLVLTDERDAHDEATTTFYMDEALVQDLLARDAARRRQDP